MVRKVLTNNYRESSKINRYLTVRLTVRVVHPPPYALRITVTFL